MDTMTDWATYSDQYPTPASEMSAPALLAEATRLEYKLDWENGKASGPAFDVARYSFVTRELRHRGVI